MTETTADKLREYALRYETKAFLDGDPSCFMHKVSGSRNQEMMAWLASGISYGSRTQFLPKIQWLLDSAQGQPDAWVREGAYRQSFSLQDHSCFYRLYDHSEMFRFLEASRKILKDWDTLGGYVKANASDGLGAVEALCRGFQSSAVVPQDAKSACKRVCMFLRWMVRDGSPVDLGLWSSFIDKRTLIMPLDTHVLTEACRLGLMNSRTASMSAARKLTSALAEVFPEDPLKGDFALFGYGVDPK